MSVQVHDNLVDDIKTFIVERSIPQSIILYTAGESQDSDCPYYEVALLGLTTEEIKDLQSKIDAHDFNGRKVQVFDLGTMDSNHKKVIEEEGMLLFGAMP